MSILQRQIRTEGTTNTCEDLNANSIGSRCLKMYTHAHYKILQSSVKRAEEDKTILKAWNELEYELYELVIHVVLELPRHPSMWIGVLNK